MNWKDLNLFIREEKQFLLVFHFNSVTKTIIFEENYDMLSNKIHKHLALIVILFPLSISAQWESQGLLISDPINTHYRSKISVLNNNNAFIAWNEFILDTGSVRVTCIDKNGIIDASWPSGGLQISGEGNYYAPEISSFNGSVCISWYGTADSMTNEHIYLQRVSADADILLNAGHPIQISTFDTLHHKYPTIVPDGSGGFFISWTSYDLPINPSSADIYVQHIDSMGQSDPLWPTEGIQVAGKAGIREYWPRIAFSEDQNSLYLLYTEGLIGNSSIKLKKINTLSGTIDSLWPTDGLVLSPGPDVWGDLDKEQYLFIDQEGYICAFWLESRVTDNGEIFLQKIDSTGAIHLSNNGKKIGGAYPEGTGYVDITMLENGNFALSFNNYSVWYDISAISVNSDGLEIWSNLNITNDGNSAYPQICSNGNGGVYIAYKRMDPSPTELFGISLDSTGQLSQGWNAPGSSFGSVGTYSGFFPHRDFNIAFLGGSNALVSWDRFLSGIYSLFACNLTETGINCSATAIEHFESPEFISIFPNPFADYFIVHNIPDDSNYHIALFDCMGRQILQQDGIHQGKKINTSSLPEGLYIYVIESKENLIQKGIIVKVNSY